MEGITKVLYWISTGLLIPVLILLIIFFLRALLLIGSFYGVYIQKLKFNKNFKNKIDELDVTNIQQHLAKINDDNKLLITIYINKVLSVKPGKVYYDKVLNDFEMACQKDLANSQTLARLGPILGLMGTLIPMGPALVGLAAGDIASMASNMQVAFATTVIGLFSGAVGFVVMQVKRRWYATDIGNLEFITELLKESQKIHKQTNTPVNNPVKQTQLS